MRYNPAFARTHYDRLADNEWTRLTRNRRGELNFLMHVDVLRRHITEDMDVLEIGAGAGIYTKELVHMVRRLVVSEVGLVTRRNDRIIAPNTARCLDGALQPRAWAF